MRNFLTLVTALALTGCAGAKIKQERVPLRPGGIAKGETIFVKEISADNATFTGDKSEDDKRVSDEKKIIKHGLASEIIIQLNKRGFVGKPYAPGAKGVVLDGVVTLFEHGSGAARAWVGMGAGSSNMHVDVKLHRGAETLADLEVIATSGGRGGLTAMASFLHAHMQDAAAKTVKYLEQRAN